MKYPELQDFIESEHESSSFFVLKEFIELLHEIANRPGINHMDLVSIINDAQRKCEYLESDEYKEDREMEMKTLHRIEILAKDLNI